MTVVLISIKTLAAPIWAFCAGSRSGEGFWPPRLRKASNALPRRFAHRPGCGQHDGDSRRGHCRTGRENCLLLGCWAAAEGLPRGARGRIAELAWLSLCDRVQDWLHVEDRRSVERFQVSYEDSQALGGEDLSPVQADRVWPVR